METSKSICAASEPGIWWKPGQSNGLKILPELQTERELSPVGAPVPPAVIPGADIIRQRTYLTERSLRGEKQGGTARKPSRPCGMRGLFNSSRRPYV